MARKVQIMLTDDIDGTDIPEGQEATISFALDGTAYEIDLNKSNADKLRKAMEKYVVAARKVGKASSGGGGGTRQARASANGAARMDREQANAIRAWAKDTGKAVADRGRIPGDIVAAYQLAHAG